ncbi:MAG: TIGR00270 family protein [Euryarchaeota archaeon RBG_16_62_10]|nr:MAG: TIGR00270 family protein [Euryarchaeota archaeon RBG_16_62_10]
MICELCGKNVTFCKKVTIEGVQLEVCTECSKFGIEAKKEPRKEEEEAPRPIIAQRLEEREKRARPKDVLAQGEKEDLAEDYGARIRNARSKKGMTQKDLAMKINERVTVLSKVESGDMTPEDKLVAKLEKELGIKLKEKVAEVLASKPSGTRSLTLADLIRMQKD